jgi:hypothetical protein
MKTPKDIDVLRKADWFSDTPEIVARLKNDGEVDVARHLHRMHIYHKALIAEVRKLRRQLKRGADAA